MYGVSGTRATLDTEILVRSQRPPIRHQHDSNEREIVDRTLTRARRALGALALA